MTAREDAALALAVLRIVKRRLDTADGTTADTIIDAWQEGDRTAAILPGGARIGAITLAKGRSSAAVTDRATFQEWVFQTHPEEIETVTVTRVRPAFESAMISAAKAHGEPVDSTTGETITVESGISMRLGDPYPVLRLEPDAAELVAAAWQAGELAELVGAMLAPAIESGDR